MANSRDTSFYTPACTERKDPILVAVSDFSNLSSLEDILKKEGYEIYTAQDYEEMIELIKRHHFSLIICDTELIEKNGNCLQQLEIQPYTMLLIFSEKGAGENLSFPSQWKAFPVEILNKPLNNVNLIQLVRTYLEKSDLVKENIKLAERINSQESIIRQNNELLIRERLLGAKIHKRLLAGNHPPEIPGFSIAAYTSTAQEMGGDFYDFYKPISELFDVVIGDAMGKGIPAALVGTAVKSELVRLANPSIHVEKFDKNMLWHDDLLSPDEIFTKMHKELVSNLVYLDYFVSIFYARFNLTKRTVSYIDCGSAKPIHYLAKKEAAVFLSGKNVAFGMDENDYYAVQEISYGKGDFFVFYTDGLIEAKSPTGELFGEDRLIHLVKVNSYLNAQDLLLAIKTALNSFVQKDYLNDDLTIIVVKIDEILLESRDPIPQAKFLSDLSQLKAVRSFVERICQNVQGNKDEIVSQLQLAINEVFCNIVNHGNKENNIGHIVIKGEYTTEGVVIDIADQGDPFSPSNVVEPSLAGDRSSGFGWYIIREIADELVYIPRSKNKGWNHTRVFKKYIVGENLMELENETVDGILIIIPKVTTLDAKDAPDFKEKVMDLIASKNINKVVIDMHQLHFIDSSGLGCFLSILRALHAKGGDLKLFSMNKPIRTMFELVSMHKIFEIFSGKEDAIRSFH